MRHISKVCTVFFVNAKQPTTLHGISQKLKEIGSLETSLASYAASQRHTSELHTPQQPVKWRLCNHLPPHGQLRHVFLVSDNVSTNYANGYSVTVNSNIIIVF